MLLCLQYSPASISSDRCDFNINVLKGLRTEFFFFFNTKTKQTKMKVIVVEGNIASGKTSLLQKVWKKMSELKMENVRILLEPLEAYENYNDVNPLELLYRDPQKNAYFTQGHIIESMTNHLHCALKFGQPATLVTERTLQSARLFIDVMAKLGHIENYEKQKLLDYVKKGIDSCPHGKLLVDKVFFINTPPEVCYDRIRTRGRKGENAIPLDYLRLIESEYESNMSSFAHKHGPSALKVVHYGDALMEQHLIDFIKEE